MSHVCGAQHGDRLYNRGNPLPSFCPPTDQVTLGFNDDLVIPSDIDLIQRKYCSHTHTRMQQRKGIKVGDYYLFIYLYLLLILQPNLMTMVKLI